MKQKLNGAFGLELPNLPAHVALIPWENKPAAAPDRYLVDAAVVALKWRNCIITLEDINPVRALAYNERVPPRRRVNRNYSNSNLSKIKRAMREERFPFNGSSIVFDEHDWCIDGKHRLKSCHETGIPFMSLVVRGVNESTFAAIDTGKTKSFADMLYAAGHNDTNNLASALKIVDEYKTTGAVSENTGGYMQIEAPGLAEKYETLSDYGKFSNSQLEDYLTRSIAMALHYLLAEHDKTRADHFFNKLVTGIGILNSNDPFYNLRSALREIKKRSNELRTGLNRRIASAYIIKAWNAILMGKPLKHFKLTDSEEFPKILSPSDALRQRQKSKTLALDD
jgi:hypothetical protein